MSVTVTPAVLQIPLSQRVLRPRVLVAIVGEAGTKTSHARGYI